MDRILQFSSDKLMKDSVLTAKEFLNISKKALKEEFPDLEYDKIAELSVEMAKVMVENMKAGLISQRLELLSEEISSLKNEKID